MITKSAASPRNTKDSSLSVLDKIPVFGIEKGISVLIAILFAFGFAFHVSGFEDYMIAMTEGFILLCNFLVTGMILLTTTKFYNLKQTDPKILILPIALIGIVVITLGLEVLGVETGLVFGEYQYGSTFNAQIFSVPWVIGWNWALVIIGSLLFVRDIYMPLFTKYGFPLLDKAGLITDKWQPWISLFVRFDIAILAGIAAAIFDFVLEPIAIRYDYWSWSGGDVPLQNYAAWFAITFVISLILLRFNVPIRSRLAKDYFFYQFIFFLALLVYSN